MSDLAFLTCSVYSSNQQQIKFALFTQIIGEKEIVIIFLCGFLYILYFVPVSEHLDGSSVVKQPEFGNTHLNKRLNALANCRSAPAIIST